MCDFEDNLQYFCNNVSKHFYPSIKDEDVEIEKKHLCTSNEFKAVCKELGIKYPYFIKLGNDYINVYNYYNNMIQIDGLQFKLDYNNMSVKVEKENLVDIHSLDELKHIVNEYRQAYKLINETMKKLQIEKDFNE